jgi:hypothetical protein
MMVPIVGIIENYTSAVSLLSMLLKEGQNINGLRALASASFIAS